MPRTETEVRASLDAVIEDVEKHGRIYGHIADMARASRDIGDVFQRRFEQVDQRFEQVDQRFE